MASRENGFSDRRCRDVYKRQVLDVYGGKHVDTGIEKLFDILPAFGVARAWRIAVRQFINQDHAALFPPSLLASLPDG